MDPALVPDDLAGESPFPGERSVAPLADRIGATSAGTPILRSFATLDLHFVPEPGTLVLVGAGVAGLVAFGRRRGNGA